MSMYNPDKYDNTSKGMKTKKHDDFKDKREELIRHILSFRNLIFKECESLDSYIEKHPDGKAVEPFTKKLDGWSRVLNGVDILKRMYIDEKE